MHRILATVIAAATCLGCAATAPADTTRILADEAWRADLTQMATAIKDIHFKPFIEVSEADFDSAVEALDEQIPNLTDDVIIIEMAKIVSLIRDGHTRLHLPRQYPQFALEAELGHSGTAPPNHDGLKFHQLPVQFGLFENGLFITGAAAGSTALIGQQVVRIGSLPVAEAIEQARLTAFYENDNRSRLMTPDRLALPEVLRALGMVEAIDAVPLLTQDQSGTERVTNLAPLTGNLDGWMSSPTGPPPLYLRDLDTSQWFDVLPPSDSGTGAIYVQVNRFEEAPARPYSEFVVDSLAAAREAGVSRYVLDLRHNSGGIGAWTLPFVTGLTRSEFNQYGRLYVLIGRTTFSAAQHLLHQLEAYSYAMFVGEPGGAKPDHFSDPKRVELEHSGLTLRVSTLFWHSWLANDFRDAITPHIDAPLTSADWFAGRDPALTAALSYTAPATIAAQMDEQFRQQKNQNALLLFQRYLTDGTFTGLEAAIPDLVRMADKLLADGFIRPGLFVFFVVNQAYPGHEVVEAGLARAQRLAEETP